MDMDFEKIDLFAEEPKPKKRGLLGRLKDAMTSGSATNASQNTKESEDEAKKIQTLLKKSVKQEEDERIDPRKDGLSYEERDLIFLGYNDYIEWLHDKKQGMPRKTKYEDIHDYNKAAGFIKKRANNKIYNLENKDIYKRLLALDINEIFKGGKYENKMKALRDSVIAKPFDYTDKSKQAQKERENKKQFNLLLYNDTDATIKEDEDPPALFEAIPNEGAELGEDERNALAKAVKKYIMKTEYKNKDKKEMAAFIFDEFIKNKVSTEDLEDSSLFKNVLAMDWSAYDDVKNKVYLDDVARVIRGERITTLTPERKEALGPVYDTLINGLNTEIPVIRELEEIEWASEYEEEDEAIDEKRKNRFLKSLDEEDEEDEEEDAHSPETSTEAPKDNDDNFDNWTDEISDSLKRKPLHEKLANNENTTTPIDEEEQKPEAPKDDEAEDAHSPETSPEAPKEDEPNKHPIVPVSVENKAIEKLSDDVYNMIYQRKPIQELITDMSETLPLIPYEKFEAVADLYAEQLAQATDKEGNKLFSSVSEAKNFLQSLRNRTMKKYKLPIAMIKEIKEKTPLKLTPMIKRHIIPISHERGVYQF
jgi:hypothetical protein